MTTQRRSLKNLGSDKLRGIEGRDDFKIIVSLQEVGKVAGNPLGPRKMIRS
jgi:hypothetical protein